MEIIYFLFQNFKIIASFSVVILLIFLLLIVLSGKKIKLLPELIPYHMHYKNVRAVVSDSEWKDLAKLSHKKANYRCEICGVRDRLECHEVWEFNDFMKVQSLIGLTSLCKDCHRVKHIGLAKKMGWYQDTLQHMCKVNKISFNKAIRYIEIAEENVKKRNFEYSLDLRYLNQFSNILSRKYSKRENENCSIINGNY